MDLKLIPAGRNPPKDIHAVIEIPLGGVPVKYEFDKKSGAIFVDRFLHTAMYYPGNYGFIPQTLSEDGDPCDIMVITQVPVVPGAVIRCRPVGALLMEDEAGKDEKILAVPVDKLHPFYTGVAKLQATCRSIMMRADRPLLPALQGPGEGQVGDDREMDRRGRCRADHRRRPRASQEAAGIEHHRASHLRPRAWCVEWWLVLRPCRGHPATARSSRVHADIDRAGRAVASPLRHGQSLYPHYRCDQRLPA